MSSLDEIKATFFEECAELMEQLEAGLLALEAGEQNDDTVDAVFRAVHSIKGGAGAFGLGGLVAFAHEFETVLDGVRTGRMEATQEVLSILLRACDGLGDVVDLARNGQDNVPEFPEDLLSLSANLAAPDADGATGDADFGLDADLDFAPVPLQIDLEPEAEDAATDDLGIFETVPSGRDHHGSPSWRISFEPLPDLLESGNEPLFLFRSLRVQGNLKCRVDDSDLPSLSDLDPSIPRLRWVLTFYPTAEDLTETEIESVFEFADDLCVLEIAPNPEPDETMAPVAEAVVSDVAPPETPSPDLIAPPPSEHPMPSKPPEAPRGAVAERSSNKSTLSTTIRVDLERIDRLVNLAGELVISQSMLSQSIIHDGLDSNSESASGLDDLQQLTRDIQDSVMAIRAQPVKSLFQRMSRIVREAAQMTDKDVRMETTGETTEIDKTVVERLADPLTHMIRNAIDHGLEAPEERVAAGKPKTGLVRLSARQKSDRVVIEVSDDGRGINRAKVLERAISRGLVPAESNLDPSEIDRLLFMPGFSTAEGVSALSGRGVGMDVVQRSIRDLNGTISISSAEGVGSTLSISLPLTLAILDGMIVRSAAQRMVIPLSAIIETQTVSAARIEVLGADKTVVQLHERFVPVVDLARGMGFGGSAAQDTTDDDDSALLFVQTDDQGPFAVQVDAIEAQRQVVIKGLGSSFGRVPCVSAATILGDGQVALIVDPSGLAATTGLAHLAQQLPPEGVVPCQK